jgi:hypothetical protein
MRMLHLLHVSPLPSPSTSLLPRWPYREKRERFARELSASLHRQFPRYRVMVVSVPWEISGTGIVRQRAELK